MEKKMVVGYKSMVMWIVATAYLSWLISKSRGRQGAQTDLDVLLETPQYITKYGYPVETHTVTTEDGYLLTVHRIPGSPKASPGGVKTPVFLQHGLTCSSDMWVCTGPERGLGFLLADQGYDVWMGNARGNFYSRNHTHLTPTDTKFWDFTWHEMGVYDLPAVIDHILATTNQSQLFYVGHSMGATMFFVFASMRPEYNAKIRLMVALAPAAFFGNPTLFTRILHGVVFGGEGEILTRTSSMYQYGKFACMNGHILQPLCTLLYHSVTGFNMKELNGTLLQMYVGSVFSGTSSYTYLHFTQLGETARFQQYDREAKVKSSIALMPEYNLSLVTTPVSIHYADKDALVATCGVLRLAKSLPNVVNTSRLSDDEAGHMDFMFGNHVKRLINDDIIDLLRRS